MPSVRGSAAWLRERATLLGVLAVVAAVDAGGAITSVFTADPESASCPAAEPVAVLTDESTVAIGTDPVVRYAPLVYLDRPERYLPMPVDCFLKNAELRWAWQVPGDDPVVEEMGGIDPERLGGARGGYSFDDRGVFQSHEFTRPHDEGRARLSGRRGFYLDLLDRYRFGAAVAAAEERAVSGTPVYYEFLPGRYVTYWFFYGFSAPAGAKSRVAGMLGHEGDWERITVRLSGTAATEVAYYQHAGEPEVVAYAAVEKRGTHPVVFSGRASHASYQKPGLQARFVDRTGRGREWRTWEFLADATMQPWSRFGGAWGVARSVSATVKAGAARVRQTVRDGDFTGPSGPCTKKPAPDEWLLDPTIPPPGPGVCAPR